MRVHAKQANGQTTSVVVGAQDLGAKPATAMGSKPKSIGDRQTRIKQAFTPPQPPLKLRDINEPPTPEPTVQPRQPAQDRNSRRQEVLLEAAEFTESHTREEAELFVACLKAFYL